jgi:hypothetical protein
MSSHAQRFVDWVGGVVWSYRVGILTFSACTMLHPLIGSLYKLPGVMWPALVLLYAVVIMVQLVPILFATSVLTACPFQGW